MLNEAKISKPRRDRGRGQGFEVKAEAEAEANFLRSRPRPRPHIKLWIKSTKWWLTAYRWIYIIMIKTTQFNFSSFSVTVTTFYMYHCVMSCSRQTDWSVSWLLVLLLQTEARPRPNVWGQGRGRGQGFEAEIEAEVKSLSSGPLWPWGLNTSAVVTQHVYIILIDK